MRLTPLGSILGAVAGARHVHSVAEAYGTLLLVYWGYLEMIVVHCLVLVRIALMIFRRAGYCSHRPLCQETGPLAGRSHLCQ